MKEISRKNFLRVCGSIVAGGAVAGMSGTLLKRRAGQAGFVAPAGLTPQPKDTFTSPYRRVASFETGGAVQALAQHGGTVYVAAAGKVAALDARGKLLRTFPVRDETVRDMAVDGDAVYLLHPAKVSVYATNGALLRAWEACSELSNYCALALSDDFVFVTDMDNKNICKYTRDGRFVTFISSPNRFIIPSLTFGIACVDNVLYCSNSGRHQVESYTLNGEYLGVFGRHGEAPGLFTGCCNPVHLLRTDGGELLTSEKGTPRICCYGRDGAFHSMLLDSRALGGGNAACDVAVWNDRLFVAGRHSVSVFRYDASLASAGACATCGVNCPLRKGTNV